MPRSKYVLGAAALTSAIAIGVVAHGPSDAKRIMRRPPRPVRVDFALLDAPLGAGKAPAAAARPRSLAGSALAALADGALVVDGDSGALIRTDRAGAVLATLALRPDASQVAVDRTRGVAYVANRQADEIAVVSLADRGLHRTASFTTDAEPYGVALTPSGDTLLVTTVADRSLAAYDTSTGERRWTIDIGPEARGVAVSPSGARALVTFLQSGVVAELDLTSTNAPRPRYRPLNPAETAAPTTGATLDHLGRSTPATGRKFARNAFAATFIGHDLIVVPHQISRPQAGNAGAGEVRSTYGGGPAFDPPIAHRMAILGQSRIAMATIGVHQPRATTYDPASDTLYIAGYGSDDVIAIGDVSQASVHMKWRRTLHVADDVGADACAPTGLAVADDGSVLALCSLQRSVVSLSTAFPQEAVARVGGELATSRLSAAERRGAAMFRRGNDGAMSAFGAMACASCHPEGRTDGLSWRIEGKALQTPLLTGRIENTHPYKWDGGDADLPTSLTHTVRRLGGAGITPAQAADLAAFLATLDAPRPPTARDTAAVARGKEIFTSEEAGCDTCHGGPALTNRKSYDLADDLTKVDTPSLVGLAASAPYYHDGSASTLRALVLENGTIHGMGKVSHLGPRDVDDLVAYLLTL